MSEKLCTECATEGVARKAHSRGLCITHYARLRRTGSTTLDPARRSRKGINRQIEQTVEGLLEHTLQLGECRRWIGAHLGEESGGYGYIHTPDRRPTKTLVHRLMHELAIGPIPEGYEVDHVRARGCRWSDCIWPPHLEAVTPTENALRAIALRDGDPSTCRSGLHEMTDWNTLVRKDGRRACRACNNARKLRDYHKKKGNIHA